MPGSKWIFNLRSSSQPSKIGEAADMAQQLPGCDQLIPHIPGEFSVVGIVR